MNELSDFINVFSSLIPTIGSLFFMMLLLVTYFSKIRFNSIRNKLYRYMLINIIILLLIEIITSFYFCYGNSKVIYLTLLRMTWYNGISWFFLLFLYSICFLKDIKVESFNTLISEVKECKQYFIFTIICSVAYLFFHFDYATSLRAFSYLPGAAGTFVMTYCGITVFAIVMVLLTQARNADKRKKISIILMILEISIIFTIQLFFDNIIFMGLGASIQMYFLYFNIENPDLSMIRELEMVKDNIENANRAKSDFLSNMSHEIRSPMNAIIGFSETLINSPNFDEESARNDIKHIASAGNNLLDIVNNILDISKIESGSDTLDMKKYSLKNILMELSSIIDARLDNKPLEFNINVDETIPSVLYGDSTKLFQILLNILTNSVKYTEVGKINLTIDKVIHGDYVTLKFKVSDTGFGIKEEDYSKLFEKFSRLDSAKTNEIEGTGLGLVITKKYVDLMNGKIWFTSQYGAGTTFYVDIEQKIIDKNPIGSIIESDNANNDEIEYIDCSAYNVLIVDDNKLNLKVAKRLLDFYKFNVETVSSGKDCIYNVKSGKKYDIIFLDHMMPEMDGIETLHILRSLEGYEIPPVVALTANAITGMKEMYLREGFDEYLSKPINVSELNKLINKYFNK